MLGIFVYLCKNIFFMISFVAKFFSQWARWGFSRKGYKIARHKIGTTDSSKNWKEYWEERHPSHHFPSEPHECPSCLFERDDFVGGHVIIEDAT